MKIENLNQELLKQYSYSKEYKTFDIIFEEGEICKSIGIILDGEIKIVTYTYQEKEEIINQLNKGDMFGQFILFSKHDNYFGTAIALRKTKILFITKPNLLKLFYEDENFLKMYLEDICDQSVMMKQQNKLFAHNNLKDRIIFYIKSNEKNGILEIKNIATLALILNVPRPSLSRELIKMKKEGLIEYDSHYIKYLNK